MRLYFIFFISVRFIWYSFIYNLYFLPMSETCCTSGCVDWLGTFAVAVVLKSSFHAATKRSQVGHIIRQTQCMACFYFGVVYLLFIYLFIYNLYFLPMSETVRCSGSVSWPGTSQLVWW